METIKDCSLKVIAIQDALEIFSGKWKIPIIGALLYIKEARFKELQAMVGKITPRMLSKELKELELNKLISREVLDTRPVTITYKITPYGESCESVILALYEWGLQHRVKIIGKE